MIDPKDFFVMAFENIRHRKLRAYLTMIGIFIGMASVVAFISLGQGLEDAVNEQLEIMGTNLIMIVPSGAMGVYSSMMSSGGAQLTNKDLEIVKRTKGVDLASAYLYEITKVEYGNEMLYSFVFGMPTDPDSLKIIMDMQGYGVEKGRMIRQGDHRSALAGHLLATGDFFERKVNIGDKIVIKDTNFKIIGKLTQVGNSADDSSIMIPMDTARELFDEPDKVDVIMVETFENYDIHKVVESIEKNLRKLRDVKKGEEDFLVETAEELIDSAMNVLNMIQIVVVGIAAISIIVGGVGVMNTLYTSVLERTKDIGIMKSIGAKNSHVMLIFLIESGFYGLIGGGIGCLIGLTLSKSVELIALNYLNTTMLKAHISSQLILGVLTFSFLIGTISGVLPARQAAKLKPVDALRYK